MDLKNIRSLWICKNGNLYVNDEIYFMDNYLEISISFEKEFDFRTAKWLSTFIMYNKEERIPGLTEEQVIKLIKSHKIDYFNWKKEGF